MTSSSVVRIELLNKENYDTWKLQMEAILIKNDAWNYVNGIKIKPEIVAGNAALAEASNKWDIEDQKAKSDIILSIKPSELKQIKGCNTSRDVWEKLKSIYQSSGPARKATLLKQLTLHKMADGDEVREHLRKFFDTVDKLNEMDVEINRDLLTVMLLYSLPSSFENFRCAIESRDELPDLEALRVKIIEEHDARKNDTRNISSNAMLAKRQWSKPRNATKKAENESKEPCKNVSRPKTTPFRYKCHRCRRFGHKAADCTESRQNNDSANRADEVSLYTGTECMVVVEALEAGTSLSGTRWCLDSGCTTHMGNDGAKFVSNLRACDGNVQLASEQGTTPVKGKGSVSITANVKGNAKNVKIHDVLRVPGLRTNLLSVGKITDRDFSVTFNKEKAEIIDGNGKLVAVADRKGGLYYICEANVERSEEVNIAERNEKKDSKIEWHRRMGHLNVRDLVRCERDGAVRGMSLENSSQELDCEVCLRGKMTRSPFPKESKRESKILEIVHSDVIGPMRVESNGKARYIATFIDDHSRWGEVHLLKGKHEVLNAFKNFKAFAENKHGRNIQLLQTDNGKEYINEPFDDFLRSSGIRRRLTVTHTPQQNGVAERRNRTLMDMTRCLLIDSRLPPSFWGEAVTTANYIRNRCPSRSLDGKTAHERWTGNTPDVSHLREFGSHVFVVDRTPSRGKLEDRSRKGVFVGYSDETKGYRIWILQEKRINIARDVKFVGMPRDTENDVRFENSDDDGGRLMEVETIFPPMSCEARDDGECGRDQRDAEGSTEQPDTYTDTGGGIVGRGRGRPKIEKTGLRGRPRKIYQSVNWAEELSCHAEVPLEQAVHGPEADAWHRAIASEIKSIVRNDTWAIIERPKDRKVIGGRIVLRNKYGRDGNLIRRKARLVARGFAQRPGLDCSETFAPVARLGSVRILIALAAEHGLNVRQFDIATAYLNGELEETVLMEIPKYTEKALENIVHTEPSGSTVRKKAETMLDEIGKGNRVCLLKKALYGLRQAGRCWNNRVNRELANYGARKSSADPCVFFKGSGENLIIICVYVDDILVASRNEREIISFGRHLSSVFEVSDLGDVNYCLGMEFARHGDETTICQARYVEDVLERFGMADCKPASTPVEPGSQLTKSNDDPSPGEEGLPYRELIGSLMYLAVCTRPDIAYAVSRLSQFCTCFGSEHWLAAKRVLRYLKGSKNMGLEYHRTGKPLLGYVDADWANCPTDRRSYTGHVFILGGCPVSWESRKQRSVALSSTEAEYMALSEAAKEATYLRRFLVELGFAEIAGVRVFCDNNGARKLAENPVFHGRSKHIDVRHHYVREVVESGDVEVAYMPTADMAADVLTKGVPKQKHIKCLDVMGLTRIGTSE